MMIKFKWGDDYRY